LYLWASDQLGWRDAVQRAAAKVLGTIET